MNESTETARQHNDEFSPWSNGYHAGFSNTPLLDYLATVEYCLERPLEAWELRILFAGYLVGKDDARLYARDRLNNVAWSEAPF